MYDDLDPDVKMLLEIASNGKSIVVSSLSLELKLLATIMFRNLYPLSSTGYMNLGRALFLHDLITVVGLFWLNRAVLPPTVLGPNILSKRVKTGSTVTQFGLACAQTMPRLPGACLRRAELFQMSCGRQM